MERRAKVRYPLDLRVRYHTLNKKSLVRGVGRTRNMSSVGALVIAQQEIRQGALVEMSMEWPLVLEGEIPLQFVTIGKVVRRDESCFAVVFHSHEFRTTKRWPESVLVPGGREPVKQSGIALPG